MERKLKLLIEDPLAKESDQSYFLQIVDAVSYIAYLYSINEFTTEDWANRLKKVLTVEDVLALLNIIKFRLNLKATTDDEFGVVNYPKR